MYFSFVVMTTDNLLNQCFVQYYISLATVWRKHFMYNLLLVLEMFLVSVHWEGFGFQIHTHRHNAMNILASSLPQYISECACLWLYCPSLTMIITVAGQGRKALGFLSSSFSQTGISLHDSQSQLDRPPETCQLVKIKQLCLLKLVCPLCKQNVG
jgi:hypothetical protein